MYCSKCGKELSNTDAFCSGCGAKVVKANSEETKTVRLKCQECDGVMDIDESKQVIMCPYCGSKKLIPESDKVKIERIRSEAQRDVDIEKVRSDAEVETSRIQADKEIELVKENFEVEKKKGREELIQGIVAVVILIGMMFLFNYLIP